MGVFSVLGACFDGFQDGQENEVDIEALWPQQKCVGEKEIEESSHIKIPNSMGNADVNAMEDRWHTWVRFRVFWPMLPKY